LLDRIGRGPLVGRQRELVEALADLRRVLAGEGRVLVISGEPGVGKTRLAQEIMARMQAAGGMAHAAGCYAEGDLPYAPMSRIIRDSFPQAAALDLSESVLADLITLAPALRSHYPSVPANSGLDARSEQQRLFESVAAWCEALCARSPLLLLVDDVQWADRATLLLLRQLARRGHRLRLLLVMTLRDSESEQAPGLGDVLLDLNRERLATHLRLARLGRDETGDLLSAMFAEEVHPDLLDGIYEQTEGNPFFVEEVCKDLIEEGKLVYRDGRWQPSSMARIKIPQTVRAAILARVARVPEPAQEALRLAAIIGREFDLETLQRAGDLNEETLITALESAQRAQLISEVESADATCLRFSFVHALIPTALRESTMHLRRRLLHGRVTQALEALRPDDFEALAYHSAEAGDSGRAHKYYGQAGKRALTWAPEDAIRLFRAALKYWPDADVVGRAETQGRLGYCLWVTGDVGHALEYFETAYELFRASDQRVPSGEVQRMIGRIYWAQADLEGALRHYHQALEILEQGPETVELARAISSISQVHMLNPEPDEAVAWGERALAMARRLGAEDVIVHALNNIGTSYCQASKDWDRGFALLQESVERALALKSPADVCRGYYNLAVALQRQCRYAAAGEWLEKLRAYATTVYSRNYANLAVWRLIWLHWDTGNWRAALAYRDELVEFSAGLYATWAGRTAASINIDVGRIEEARNELEERQPTAFKADDLQTTVPHLGQLIRVYALPEQAAEAADAVQSILARLARRPYPLAECIMPLVFACRYLSEQAETSGSETGLACLSHLERLDAELHTEESRAALTEARGWLALAEGRATSAAGAAVPSAAAAATAAEHFGRAAAGWAAIERCYDQARALACLGRALILAGDPAGARTACAPALDIAESLAAQLDVDELRSSFLASPLVQEIRQVVDAPPGPPEMAERGRDLAGLTERETEVLRLVAQGLTNAEIAEHLVVSPLTVNAHLRSIFNKLDVTRRASAVRFAVEHGLV
jgi:DNA-binding CsgD family transcriptional regulator/tetratricopeptide (TPR) repeat protein